MACGRNIILPYWVTPFKLLRHIHSFLYLYIEKYICLKSIYIWFWTSKLTYGYFRFLILVIPFYTHCCHALHVSTSPLKASWTLIPLSPFIARMLYYLPPLKYLQCPFLVPRRLLVLQVKHTDLKIQRQHPHRTENVRHFFLDSDYFTQNDFFIFISPPSDFIILFFFTPGQKSIMPVYHPFFILLPVSMHRLCFHYLATVSRASMGTGEEVSL